MTIRIASDDAWAKYWLFYILLSGIVGIITTIWFLWGGLKDLADLYRMLSSIKRDELDDGSVEKHRNLEDIHKVNKDEQNGISIEKSI